MYSYKLVYSLIDSKTLKYFNEMMISILSVKYYMPEINIIVVTDSETVQNVRNNNKIYEDFKKYADFCIIPIPDCYNQKEKSRFIKTSLRKWIEGDYLFIDTDTIIAGKFPEIISNYDVAMVLDGNCYLDERIDKTGTKYLNQICSIELDLIGENREYYNSGVMWIKDTKASHMLYDLWHDEWKESVKTGNVFDQPTLNKIIRTKKMIVDNLDGKWNCQVSSNPFPIEFLHSALIIHYYNDPGSSYLMCDSKFKSLKYDEKEIDLLIKHPKRYFKKSVLFTCDEYGNLFSSRFFKIVLIIYRKKSLFNLIENILGKLTNIKNKML